MIRNVFVTRSESLGNFSQISLNNFFSIFIQRCLIISLHRTVHCSMLLNVPEDVWVDYIFPYCYTGDLYVLRKTCMTFCWYINKHYTEEEDEDHDSSSPYSLINFPNPLDEQLDAKWFVKSPFALIRWAIYNGCSVSSFFIDYLAFFGRVNVLKWLFPEGMKYDSDSAINAAIRGKRFHTVKWLWRQMRRDKHIATDETKSHFDDYLLAVAIKKNDFKITKWLVKQGIKVHICH